MHSSITSTALKLPALAALTLLTQTAAPAALVTFSATGSAPAEAALATSVNDFRTAISGGSGNNGVAGGPFTAGRREINWDAAGLDSSAVPNSMPGSFFNDNSKRGAVFSAAGGGSLLVSGRIAAASPDLRFSTLNASYATTFQAFSADRLFGLSGTNTLTADFFVPNQTTVSASISGFGAVFTDVDLVGSRIEAFDFNNILIGSVEVPVFNNGLSFAGLSFNAGERIGSIRITSGTGGLGVNDDPGNGIDMVAMDDFFYSEPLAVPEPTTALMGSMAAFGLLLRRRR